MIDDTMIRPAVITDMDDLIDININVWHSTYRGMLHDELLDSMTPDSLRNKWKQTLSDTGPSDRLCYIAAKTGQVIGYVVCGKNSDVQLPFDWELYAIYLLAKHQGQGIGKKLFLQAVEGMKTLGVQSFMLFVLEENLATRKFYEAFRPDFESQRSIELGGRQYAEICYGWSTISFIG